VVTLFAVSVGVNALSLIGTGDWLARLLLASVIHGVTEEADRPLKLKG
jgi:hypothetical protein